MTASGVVRGGETSIRWLRWPLGLALAGAAIAAFVLGSQYLGGTVRTDDAFVEVPIVYVSAQVRGRVVQVLAQEHERVEQGQLLLQLDDAEYEIERVRAKASLALAHSRVAQAEAASASADAERKAAVVELWRTQRELSRVRSLRAEGTASQRDLDSAQASHDAAVANVRALELRVEAEHALVNDDAQVRLAEAAVKSAELMLERTRVRAPFAGVVGRRSAEPGAVIAPGQPLLALVSAEDISVMANFKETQLPKIRIGAPAEVTIDAFPGVVWRGRVDSFSPATGAEYALVAPEPAAGNFTKVVQRVPVKIVLERQPREGSLPTAAGPMLAAGLSAEVVVSVR